MNVRGTRATMSFSAEADIREWAGQRRAQPGAGPARATRRSAALDAARERLSTHTLPALERLDALS